MNDTFIFIFTVLASTEGFLLALVLSIGVLVYQKQHWTAAALLTSAGALILVVNVLKETLRVPRPTDALIETVGYAFPSGHAAGSLFLALVISFLCRKLRAPLRAVVVFLSVALALMIGWSRTALMVHTPAQVAAGFAVGFAFSLLFMWLATSKH